MTHATIPLGLRDRLADAGLAAQRARRLSRIPSPLERSLRVLHQISWGSELEAQPHLIYMLERALQPLIQHQIELAIADATMPQDEAEESAAQEVAVAALAA